MPLPKFPKISNPYFIAFVATVGGMLFGFDISSMSAIIGTEQYVSPSTNTDLRLSTSSECWIANT
jgi:hypothetical protein